MPRRTRTNRQGRLREYRTTVWGVRTRAIEVAGEGRPIVLVHGFCDSADTWRAVLERLAAAGRRAIAYDMPGFGFAERAGHGNLVTQQEGFVAEAVRRAAEASGEQVVVAGNSLGGWVSLRIGARDDLPVAAISPIAPAGQSLSPWFFRLDRIPGATRLINLPVPVPDSVTREMVARAFHQLGYHDRSRIDAATVRRFTLHNRKRSVLRWRLEEAKRVKPELERPWDAARIEVPTTIIWGVRDLLCLAAGAEPLAESISGSKLLLLDDVGHCPQIEVPDVVTPELLELSGPLAAWRGRRGRGAHEVALSERAPERG